MKTALLAALALFSACHDGDHSTYLDQRSCDVLVQRTLRLFESVAQGTELVLRDPDTLTPMRELGECIGAQFMFEEVLEGCAVHDFEAVLPVCEGVIGVRAARLEAFQAMAFEWQSRREDRL
jgi:hypothetical protein